MAFPKVAAVAFSALLAFYFAGAVGYRLGFEAGDAYSRRDARVEPDVDGSKAETKDAINRWLTKTNPREMPGRYASLMRFPDRTCIQLKFVDPTSTGGEPIYCYRSGTLQLTEEHSNVE
jgi:hypothetical protein